MYTYDPDQQNTKPFWQRIFGRRNLLGSAPSSQAGQHIGKGRFWGTRSTSPSPVMPIPTQHGTASRPTLKRQNAFKLSEDESQALTRHLGLSSAAHSGSGHDLLSEASGGATQAVTAAQADGRAAGGADGIMPSVKGSLEAALSGATQLTTASSPLPDFHQPFNATSAYANVTRCNSKRWVALHTSGTLQSKPSYNHSTASCLRPCQALDSLQSCHYPYIYGFKNLDRFASDKLPSGVLACWHCTETHTHLSYLPETHSHDSDCA